MEPPATPDAICGMYWGGCGVAGGWEKADAAACPACAACCRLCKRLCLCMTSKVSNKRAASEAICAMITGELSLHSGQPSTTCVIVVMLSCAGDTTYQVSTLGARISQSTAHTTPHTYLVHDLGVVTQLLMSEFVASDKHELTDKGADRVVLRWCMAASGVTPVCKKTLD